MGEQLPEQQIAALEAKIVELQANIARAKGIVQKWVDASASLSRSAAQARAENQNKGRGIVSAFLGAKWRRAVRADAAASNAAIAKDVAAKREFNAQGKREAQDFVRELQQELSEAKQTLKQLTGGRKAPTRAKAAIDSLAVLEKLKQAHTAGLLTDAEFEEKRKKLVADL